jgi:hypothetical protein
VVLGFDMLVLGARIHRKRSGRVVLGCPNSNTLCWRTRMAAFSSSGRRC